MSTPAASIHTPVRWNLQHLGAALLIGFVLQSVYLPCLCSIGAAKMTIALAFMGLV